MNLEWCVGADCPMFNCGAIRLLANPPEGARNASDSTLAWGLARSFPILTSQSTGRRSECCVLWWSSAECSWEKECYGEFEQLRSTDGCIPVERASATTRWRERAQRRQLLHLGTVDSNREWLQDAGPDLEGCGVVVRQEGISETPKPSRNLYARSVVLRSKHWQPR